VCLLERIEIFFPFWADYYYSSSYFLFYLCWIRRTDDDDCCCIEMRVAGKSGRTLSQVASSPGFLSITPRLFFFREPLEVVSFSNGILYCSTGLENKGTCVGFSCLWLSILRAYPSQEGKVAVVEVEEDRYLKGNPAGWLLQGTWGDSNLEWDFPMRISRSRHFQKALSLSHLSSNFNIRIYYCTQDW